VCATPTWVDDKVGQRIVAVLPLGTCDAYHPNATGSRRLLESERAWTRPWQARRLLRESKLWPRLIDRPPPWRRAEWWERQRLKESLASLGPTLRLAIKVLLQVLVQTR